MGNRLEGGRISLELDLSVKGSGKALCAAGRAGGRGEGEQDGTEHSRSWTREHCYFDQ